MKSKADVKLDRDTNDVIVLDEKGNEVFRKPKTEQHISIANAKQFKIFLAPEQIEYMHTLPTVHAIDRYARQFILAKLG